MFGLRYLWKLSSLLNSPSDVSLKQMTSSDIRYSLRYAAGSIPTTWEDVLMVDLETVSWETPMNSYPEHEARLVTGLA